MESLSDWTAWWFPASIGENPSYIPPELPVREQKPFVFPDRNGNSRRILEYLSGRGISERAIRYCLRLGILYESRPYHNAVFIGKDENGKARYAFLRGYKFDCSALFKEIEQQAKSLYTINGLILRWDCKYIANQVFVDHDLFVRAVINVISTSGLLYQLLAIYAHLIKIFLILCHRIKYWGRIR